MDFRFLAVLFFYFAGFVYSVTNNLDVEEIKKSVQEIPGLPNDTAIPSIEEVEKVIREKCQENGGDFAYDNLQSQKGFLQECVQNTMNFTVVKEEVEEAKKTGSMDEVFSKYCKKIPDVMSCVQNVTDAAGDCLEGREKDNLLIVLNVTESLLEFVCNKDGDRIAMFIAEGGVECLEDQKDALQACVNQTLSGRVPTDLSVDTLPMLMFDARDCSDFDKLQHCAVEELEKCTDHTPANIVDALFKFVKRVTPCGKNREEVKVLGMTGVGSTLKQFTYLTAVILPILMFL